MAAIQRRKWPIIGWNSFKNRSHLPPPLPGFSAEASDDIRCIARLLEDIDKLTLETLVAEKLMTDESVAEFKSNLYEHNDAELWAYLAVGGQYTWKAAFDALLLLLGNSAGTKGYAQVCGKIKAFEFALALSAMLAQVQGVCKLPPVIKYRLLAKSEIILSFLETAEATWRERYLDKLYTQSDVLSKRDVKFIRFPTKYKPVARNPGEISIAKPSTITALVCIISLICTTLQLLSFTTTLRSAPLGPPTYKDPEFLGVLQQLFMQTLGLFTLLAPALSAPKDQSAWIWTLSSSSLLFGCATIPAYLLHGNALSALLSSFGSVLQTFVILQIVLKGAGSDQAGKEKEHVE